MVNKIQLHNFLNGGDVYVDSEAYTNNITDYIITLLAIKYDNNITTKVKQLSNPVMDYLGYV
jgi:hypothetical protein